MLSSKVGFYLYPPSPECFDRRANPPILPVRHCGFKQDSVNCSVEI